LVYVGHNDIEKAYNSVGAYGNYLEGHHNLTLKAVYYFLQGLIMYQNNRPLDAKEYLKKCLELSNSSVSHNQLTAMALNILGSVFFAQGTNFDACHTMFKSSLVLSYRVRDLNSQLISLQLLSQFYDKTGDRLNQGYNLSYYTKTKDDLKIILKELISDYKFYNEIQPFDVIVKTCKKKKIKLKYIPIYKTILYNEIIKKLNDYFQKNKIMSSNVKINVFF